MRGSGPKDGERVVMRAVDRDPDPRAEGEVAPTTPRYRPPRLTHLGTIVPTLLGSIGPPPPPPGWPDGVPYPGR